LIRFGWFLRAFCFSFLFRFFVFFSLTFTDTFFTLDVYLGHGDAVRVVDPELGKLERENIGHELPPHGISLNTPILGTTSTSTRRHTRRESNPGMTRTMHAFDIFINDVSCFRIFFLLPQQMQKKMIL
jgi:hypothetical protein